MLNIDVRVNTHDELPGSDLYKRTTQHLARDFLSYAPVLADVLAIIACGALSDVFVSRQALFQPDFSKASIVACIFYILIFKILGSYSVSANINLANRCINSILSWFFSLTLLAVVSFVLKAGERYVLSGEIFFALASFFGVVTVNLTVARFIAVRVKERSIAFARVRIVTLSTEPLSPYDDVWGAPPGVELTGRHSIVISAPDFAEQCRELRTVLQRAAAEGSCDQILLAALWQDKGHISALLNAFGPLPAPVILLSDPAIVELSRHRRIALGDNVGFELQSAPLGWGARRAKRALDISVALIAILCLSPLMLLAAAALWLESGSPILFAQDRRGFGGIPFKIMKLRSMTTTHNGKDIPQTQRNDPRVTTVGRILRRTSIDELPQLFNVLKGEMSIVGPRPHAVAHDDYYDQFIEHYAFRHHVKPGITGWAQVNGLRGATETSDVMRARIEHDLWYINHWSLWLDLKIIFRTAFKVLVDDSAY
jgi:Undecaprenyl-phosphate glucose phosphotransferase